MRHLAALLLLTAIPQPALTQTATPDTQAIRQVMEKQAADWNRGDLVSFAAGYKNSPDIIFVGRTVTRGYAGMLERYRKGYPTPDAMGKLSFTNLEVVPLDRRFATSTGNFHLERTPIGGGNADGIFSLVYEKTPAGWKIIRDHTTAFLPPPAKPRPSQ